MARIVPLADRGKRLRSLDEFEPPPWARQGRRRRAGASFLILLALFAAAGAAIGWMLPF